MTNGVPLFAAVGQGTARVPRRFPRCAALAVCLLAGTARASAPVELTAAVDEYELGTFLDTLEDPSAALTVDQVASPEWADRFLKSARAKPNFGYTRSAYWARFTVRNNRDNEARFLLELVGLLDRIELFEPRPSGGFAARSAGRWTLPEGREVKHRNTLFRIDLPVGQERTCYVRLQSQGGMQFPMTLWTERAFAAADHEEQLVNGLYYGIMLVMLLYNFFLFLAVRDRAYLYYVAYIAAFSLLQLGIAGLTHEYLLPRQPWLANVSVPASIGLAVLFATLFGRSFLSTSASHPRLDRWLQVVAVAGALVAVAPLAAPYALAVQAGIVIGMLASFTLLGVGGLRLYDGYVPARFFLLSWLVLVLGVLVIGMRNFNFLPINSITSHAAQIGSALEVVLLSLALADRIAQMRRDKEATQARALEVQLRMSQSFARFVPNQFLRFLGKQDLTDVQLGDAVQREMTVFFSDIRSFTALSEKLSPRETFEFVNEYLKRIGPIVRDHSGFIDKYIGDAVMALFPESPSDAVAAAVAMRHRVVEYNAERAAAGLAAVDIGVGIHTGTLMLGTVGEAQRMEGTVIADAVNLASRLEGLTKMYGSAIIVSERTLVGLVKGRFRHRFLDCVRVKGKSEPVSIYEILDGAPEEARQAKLRSLSLYEAALASFAALDFATALERFAKVRALSPADKAVELYQHRCEQWLAEGPPAAGVWGAPLEKG